MPTPQEREGALFRAAVELPPGATRGPFLDQACAGDPSLRQSPEALLAAYEQPRTLLATQGETARPTIKLDGARSDSLRTERRWRRAELCSVLENEPCTSGARRRFQRLRRREQVKTRRFGHKPPYPALVKKAGVDK